MLFLRFVPALLCASAILSGADAHWIRLRSTNFEMYTSASPRSARETLKYFEQVRAFFLETVGRTSEKPSPVRIVGFSSAKEFEPYRINQFAAAYYHETAERDYIVLGHTGGDVFPIAVHEYVHLVVRHGKLELPPWLNEGLAELYSTLKPRADKILVGDLIPGRLQALVNEKWVPLATILAAGHDSPYYNEKNKAGSLYNEGWALTHMLALRDEYRPKFSQLVGAINGGQPSADALVQVYGKPLAQIEKDLQQYLRGDRFQGALFPARLLKDVDEVDVEALPMLEVDLALADLTNTPGKQAEARKRFQALAEAHPERPEPHAELGYLAWRDGHSNDARVEFGKAFALGERGPRMLWDYGRMVEGENAAEAVRVFSTLSAIEPDRVDVRIELAQSQVRAGQPKEALLTIATVKKVSKAEAPRFFEVMAYANVSAGNVEEARKAAEDLQKYATSAVDRAYAERLLQQLKRSPTGARAALPPPQSGDDGPPVIRRGAENEEEETIAETMPAGPARLWASGRFLQLDCGGAQAKITVETSQGKQVFLIENPNGIAVTSQREGPVDLTCGPQTNPPTVRVEYVAPAAGQSGVQGLLRAIVFEK